MSVERADITPGEERALLEWGRAHEHRGRRTLVGLARAGRLPHTYSRVDGTWSAECARLRDVDVRVRGIGRTRADADRDLDGALAEAAECLREHPGFGVQVVSSRAVRQARRRRREPSGIILTCEGGVWTATAPGVRGAYGIGRTRAAAIDDLRSGISDMKGYLRESTQRRRKRR